jgi:crotonobetainyl-CoA:carnitine CoA-transferase CaiB-like acyl-CoA transferase
MSMTTTNGALAGLRVLDATQMLAGPIAGMRLGDLGAEVIKIENPETGEFNRTHGYADVNLAGHMTTFLALNRNKRSFAVNLKDPAGKAVFLDLVRESDVVLQNFRPGVVDRLGIDYASLAQVNSRLVYCSISGYGGDGPGSRRPGQDLVLQGYSGSMWFVGKDGDPPAPGGIPAIDAMTGYQAVAGILAALFARTSTGRGQHVEVDMLSVVLDAQIQELTTYLNSGLLPQRGQESSAHAWIPAPYGVHRTSDGWLTMGMCAPAVLGEALDVDRLREMTSYEDGLAHADEIYRLVRAELPTRTTAEWIEHFDRYNIWTGPVYTYADVERDPQVRARGLVTEFEHPEAGPVRTVNVPIRLSDTPTAITSAAPLLGQHTEELMTGLLGYPSAQVEALTSSGAVALHPQAVLEPEGSVQ